MSNRERRNNPYKPNQNSCLSGPELPGAFAIEGIDATGDEDIHDELTQADCELVPEDSPVPATQNPGRGGDSVVTLSVTARAVDEEEERENIRRMGELERTVEEQQRQLWAMQEQQTAGEAPSQPQSRYGMGPLTSRRMASRGLVLLITVGIIIGVAVPLTRRDIKAQASESMSESTLEPTSSNSTPTNPSSWIQMGSSISGTSERFGDGIDMSSNGLTIIVAAPSAIPGGGESFTASGEVTVHTWQNGSWVRKGDVLIGSGSTWSSSPVAISSDGDTIAIGTSRSSVSRVYRWTSDTWVQMGGDIEGSDDFGYSVDLSSDGTVVAVGSPSEGDAGVARVYSWNETDWVQLGTDFIGDASGDEFGFAVSLSDDGMTLAVTGREHDGIAGVDSGHVRVYRWKDDEGQWIQQGDDIEGEGAGDWFGYSVGLSQNGRIVAIGGFFNDGVTNDGGHVRVLSFSGSSWVQLGPDIDGTGPGDYLASIAISADGLTLVAGATQEANGRLGYAKVFSFSLGVWGQLGTTLNASVTREEFGTAVGISDDGRIVAVGATRRLSTPNFGSVRIYSLRQ